MLSEVGSVSAATSQRAGAARRFVRRLQSDWAFWCSRCYFIRTREGSVRPLVPNSVQRAIRDAAREEVERFGRARIYVLKARRAGVTTGQQAENLHQVWSEPNFDAMTLAHTDGDTQKIFEITRRAVDHFPPAVLPRMGAKETSEISFPGLDSRFYTGTAGAKRTGRGLTLKRVHGSEFAFWNDPLGTLGTISPALEGVAGNMIVLETTASAYASDCHRFWKKAQEGANGYRALFFPWWVCAPEHYRRALLNPEELGHLTDEETDLRRRYGLSLEQIKWRRQQIQELGLATFLQEYAEDPESCWLASGELFYDGGMLKGLMAKAPEPIRQEMDGRLLVYADLPVGERAVIGSDTAEGVDQDRSTLVARSFPSRRLLATFADNRIDPAPFAGVLDQVGRQFGAAFLVVEKNMHGITVLRTLRDAHGYPLEQIYHRRPLDQDREDAGERIGWATTAESLPLLLDAGRALITAAAQGHADAPSRDALRDAFNVKRDKNARVSLTGKDLWVAECLAEIGIQHGPPVVSAGALRASSFFGYKR